MIKTKEINFKNNKGITLVSLIVTISVMLLVSSFTITVSLDRFEVNKYNKMINDIELLTEKVSNYYLKYNGLPIVRDDNNNPIKYPGTTLKFEKNPKDNSNYYILDLETMEAIALNYGEQGFKNPNTSDDVYIINEQSHQVYYVRGIKVQDNIYHTILNNTNIINDNIPPSRPEIRVISGDKNDEGIYVTGVEIEIIPGKDGWSGVEKTMYSINNGTEKNVNSLVTITENGTYEIKARSYDKKGNISDDTRMEITIQLSE